MSTKRGRKGRHGKGNPTGRQQHPGFPARRGRSKARPSHMRKHRG